MAKQANSFFDFDMTRFMSDLRLPTLGAQAGQLPQIPGVNVDAMVNAQKRNMETLTAANKLAFDGFQAILRRQGEIVRSAIEEASDVAGRMASTTDPQKSMAFQAEVAKEAFERAVANMRELTELATNSNTEVLELLKGRITESLDELSDALRKQPVGDAAIRATVADSAAAPVEPKAKANGSAVKAAAAPAAKPTAAAASAAAK